MLPDVRDPQSKKKKGQFAPALEAFICEVLKHGRLTGFIGPIQA
jgi:hypothetical protein